MRLHRLTLRWFRGIQDKTVEFAAAGVTVLQGRNEAGKSTFMEALRFLRIHKAASKRAEVRAVQPVGLDVAPEVEAELSSGQYRLVYSKRWLRSPKTQLRLMEPKPEQLVGDDAHDRFLEILAETTDEGLFEALEVVQGASLGQAELAQLPALRRALDSAESAPEGYQDLLAAVNAEYSLYFTPTGRPTGAYRSGEDKVNELRQQVAALEFRSREIDQLSDKHERAATDLASLLADQEQALKTKQQLEQQDRALEDLRAAEGAAKRTLGDAEASLAQAQRHLVERQELEATVTTLGQEARACRETASRLAEEESRAVAALDTAAEHQAEANAEEATLRQALATTETQLRRARDVREIQETRKVLERVEAQEERLAEALSLVEANPVSSDDVARLENLDIECRVARESWAMAAPVMELDVLGDVLLDGSELALGSHGPMPITDMEVEVPGKARIRLVAGTAGQQAEETARRAAEGLAEALKVLGVVDLTEARRVAEQRAGAARQVEAAREALKQLLADRTKAELEARTRALGEDEEAETQLPDLVELTAIQTQLREQLSEAETRAKEAQEAVESARTRHGRLREEWIRADAQAEAAQVRLSEAQLRWENALADIPDCVLQAAVAAAETELSRCEDALKAVTAQLLAADADSLTLRLENARRVVERLQDEHQELRDELAGASTLLADRMEEGVYDRLQEATAHLEVAEERHESQGRAARAVQCLRESLLRHRDEAQLRYVGPFRDRIEALGRAIFGPGLMLEVAPELRLASRTLDGVTVPFDSLSTGAREQLSLLGRLACAQLVQPGEGVPVIIDDALGFSDPERLSRLGAVLNQVGESAQIIILTCQPERFRNIGTARVVRM
ncbi:MAG: AAA family ATPase [Propionibacteriaceae bacterium]|nr:AAA family ATPase [Propionibacteriaceae bacterium]